MLLIKEKSIKSIEENDESMLINIYESSSLIKDEYNGICLHCQKASLCTFPRDPKNPVLECEEFEGYEPVVRSARRTNLNPPKSIVSSEKNIMDSKKYIGLCSNCENFKTCTFPKPESGVWECEDYR